MNEREPSRNEPRKHTGTRHRPTWVIVFLLLLTCGAFTATITLKNRKHLATLTLQREFELRVWIEEQIRDYPNLISNADQPPVQSPPIGLAALETSMSDAGLRQYTTHLTVSGKEQVDIRLGNVPFLRLADWLIQVTPGWGYRVSAFRMDRVSPGLTDVTITLASGRK